MDPTVAACRAVADQVPLRMLFLIYTEPRSSGHPFLREVRVLIRGKGR